MENLREVHSVDVCGAEQMGTDLKSSADLRGEQLLLRSADRLEGDRSRAQQLGEHLL